MSWPEIKRCDGGVDAAAYNYIINNNNNNNNNTLEMFPMITLSDDRMEIIKKKQNANVDFSVWNVPRASQEKISAKGNFTSGWNIQKQKQKNS